MLRIHVPSPRSGGTPGSQRCLIDPSAEPQGGYYTDSVRKPIPRRLLKLAVPGRRLWVQRLYIRGQRDLVLLETLLEVQAGQAVKAVQADLVTFVSALAVRRLDQPSCPCSAARCNGVLPCSSRAFTSAPAFNMSPTVPKWPPEAASWSAVVTPTFASWCRRSRGRINRAARGNVTIAARMTMPVSNHRDIMNSPLLNIAG